MAIDVNGLSSAEIKKRMTCVQDAWNVAAKDYVMKAILLHIGKDMLGLLGGAVAMVLGSALAIVIGNVGGAAIGGAIGALIGPEGIPPGAAIGRMVGNAMVQALLTVLGVVLLLEFIVGELSGIGGHAYKAVDVAWNAADLNGVTYNQTIDFAARHFAEAIGKFFGALVMAIVIVLTRRTVAEKTKLLNSKLMKMCDGLEAYIVRNLTVLEAKFSGGIIKATVTQGLPESPEGLVANLKAEMARQHGTLVPKVRSPQDILWESKGDLQALKNYLRNESNRLNELAGILSRTGRTKTKGGTTVEELRQRAGDAKATSEALDPHIREQVGHMQSVEAVGEHCNVFMEAFRKRGNVANQIRYLQHEFGMTESEAKPVVAALQTLDGVIDFVGHDGKLGLKNGATAKGSGKGSARVNGRIASPAKSIVRLIGDTMKSWGDKPLTEDQLKMKAMDPEKLSPEELKLVAKVCNVTGEAIRQGLLVDEGRNMHSPNYYHHNPELPIHWMEWACDTILALMQQRGYSKGPAKTMEFWSNEQMARFAAETSGDGSPDFAIGMLKFAKRVCYDFPLDYLQRPHAKVPEQIH